MHLDYRGGAVKIIKVGMAEMNICKFPDGITTLGLGSCVGVVLFDPYKKLAGLVHIMLPDSTKIKNHQNKAKFADTGIETLVEKMIENGANKKNLVAKIAGGAQMFHFATQSAMRRIGDANVEAVKKQLAIMEIPLLAEDTGNSYGRTIEFYTNTGELLIRSVGKEKKII